MGELPELFVPNRTAVVGATEREGAIGRVIMDNLIDEFDGEVVPVNPKYNKPSGLQCYGDVGETDADLAVIVVPPKAVLPAMKSAGEAGIQNVVVTTAGFGKTGSEGAARGQELRDIAEEYDLNVTGPNSLGIMNTGVGMNTMFGPDMAFDGNMSLMNQSGALITVVIDWANDEDIGFKDIISLGNKAVFDETDFIETWNDDPDTEVIIGYLEGISVGRGFIDSARDVTKDMLTTLVKSGKTDASVQTASSCTGTIAGSDAAYETDLEQAGVVRADPIQHLFGTARVLGNQPPPENKDVAVITNAGGSGVMMTDTTGGSELRMTDFADETLEAFSESLPVEGNTYNPVDIVGDADNAWFKEILDVVFADDNVGTALVLACPTAVLDYNQLAADAAELQEKYDKPIAACFMDGKRVDTASDVMKDAGIPNHFDSSHTADGLEALSKYANVHQREYDTSTESDVNRERAREALETVKDHDETRLGAEATELLGAYGIETPAGDIVDDPADALEVAGDTDGNVVAKIVNPDTLHKSDIGGVKVGVESEDVYDACEDLIIRAKDCQPDANILGVQVQEMANLDDGIETIVDMNRDPQFGSPMMFGPGGTFVEILEDTTSRVVPVSETEAENMTKEIDAAPMLRGARRNDPVDIGGITETIQQPSQLVTDFPVILELDINPLVALSDGVKAADAWLTMDSDGF